MRRNSISPADAHRDPQPLPGAGGFAVICGEEDDSANGGGNEGDDEGQVGLATKTRTKPKKPSQYKVLMLNDDYTPMEFVVMVLQHYFQRDLDTATHIMLKIHHEGRAVCGVYPKDIAATKVELVLAAARRDGHPLQCIMEAA
jgi:ATP-dependent Clp protease adaptor protein ClpS